MPQTPLTPEIRHIVSNALTAALAQCEAAGVPRSLALECLASEAAGRNRVAYASAVHGNNSVLENFAREARRTAYGPHRDRVAHHKAAAGWLMEKHGVRVGEVALVYGWAQPREILIESVELHMRSIGDHSKYDVVLNGPSPGVKTQTPERHVVPMNTNIVPHAASARMTALFGNRLTKNPVPAQAVA